MKQSVPWEGNASSGSREISLFVAPSVALTRSQEPAIVLNLSQMNPVPAIPFYFLKISFYPWVF